MKYRLLIYIIFIKIFIFVYIEKMKKLFAISAIAVLSAAILAGCGKKDEVVDAQKEGVVIQKDAETSTGTVETVATWPTKEVELTQSSTDEVNQLQKDITDQLEKELNWTGSVQN